MVHALITIISATATFFLGRYFKEREELKKLIREITDKALIYWGSEECDQSNSQSHVILSHLTDLEYTLKGKHGENLDIFRRAITDGDFQTKERRVAKIGSPRIMRIEQAKKDLLTAVNLF